MTNKKEPRIDQEAFSALWSEFLDEFKKVAPIAKKAMREAGYKLHSDKPKRKNKLKN